MIIPYLSASRVNNYLICPHQYYLNYELNQRQDTEVTIFGKIMHKTTELLMLSDLKNIDNHEKHTLKLFDNTCKEFPAISYDWYKLGVNLIKKMIDEEDYLWWHEGLIETPELYFEYWLNDEICVLGYIDLVVEVNKDTLVVIDHKVSKLPKSQEEVDNDIQLGIYDIVVRDLFPGYKNYDLALNYYRHSPVYTRRTDEDRENLKNFLINIFYQICNDNEHIPRRNNLCGFCVGRMNCPAYDMAENELIGKEQLYNLTPEELAIEFDKVNQIAKTYYRRKKEIEEILAEYMENQPGNKVQLGDKTITQVVQKKTVFDPYDIYDDMAIEDFLDCVSITKASLEKIAKEKPEYKEILRKGRTVVGSSYLTVK